MSAIAAELRIRTHAKRLRLPLVAGQALRFAEEAAAARHDHLEFLAALLDAEVAQRDVNVERARITQARFPELKELADFNFSLVPSLNAPPVSDLARCTFIDRREVVLAVKPPGTGKTHVSIGLGLAACRRGKRVRFVTVAELVTELAKAQAEHRLSRLEEQLDRIDLWCATSSASCPGRRPGTAALHSARPSLHAWWAHPHLEPRVRRVDIGLQR